jgi:hypothetical protein
VKNGKKKSWLKPGQPSVHAKLCDAIEKRLCGYVREGLSIEVCCDLAGISRSVYYLWRDKGLEEAEAGQHGRYAAFNRAVAAANAQAIRKLHGAVAVSNPLWILERRWPEMYGPPKLRAELSGPSNGTLPVTANPFLVEVVINGTLLEHPPIKELPSE